MPASFIRRVLLEQVRTLGLARDRLLAGFRNRDVEAEEAAAQEWNRLMSRPGTGDEDPADAAEAAHEAGLELYAALWQLEQATRNLLAAGLYHLFEKHCEMYHAKLKRLGLKRIKFSLLPGWSKLNELRLVANVTKHAEGPSAVHLREERPDLFEDPAFHKLGVPGVSFRVSTPLAGEGLYVTEDDLVAYQRAVETFWEQVASAPHVPRHAPRF